MEEVEAKLEEPLVVNKTKDKKPRAHALKDSYRPKTARPALSNKQESDMTGMEKLVSSHRSLAESARLSLLMKRECSSLLNLTRAILNKKKQPSIFLKLDPNRFKEKTQRFLVN